MMAHDLDRDIIFLLDKLITGKERACKLKKLLLLLTVSARSS